MTSFWQDVRYSLRMIAKAPDFAAIAILTLALGIGANTTIFSWINSALLNPVPGLASPSEVVAMAENKSGDNPLGFTYPDIEAMRDGQQSFTGITACMFAQMSLTGKGKPERVWGMVASANYFDLLGVRPVLGRGFSAPLHDCGRRPGGISGEPDRTAIGNLDSRHDGRTINATGQPASRPSLFLDERAGVR